MRTNYPAAHHFPARELYNRKPASARITALLCPNDDEAREALLAAWRLGGKVETVEV